MLLRPATALASIAFLAACSSDPDPAATSGSGAASGASSSAGVGGGTGGSGGMAPPTGPIAAEVKRYDYVFDLDTGAAHSKLTALVAPPGGDCFGVACGPMVTDVLWNGAAAASAAVTAGQLDACGVGVAGDAELVLEAAATVPEKKFLSLDVGFSRSNDLAGGEFSYLLSWVGGCDHFGPCDDDPSKLAEFHFEVTHPPGDVVLCPGKLTKGDTTTRCDLEGTLAPTYSAFSIAADPKWVRTPLTQVGGVDLVFYEVPGGTIQSSLSVPKVTAFFEWVTDLLGPFPYGDEVRYAGAPTYWLGFEHPASIVLAEDLPSASGAYSNPAMHVFMHETVHQWAGDRSTIATETDFVWKEATAEYLAYVFEDEQGGAGEAEASLEYWDDVSLGSQHYPSPTDQPAPSVASFYGDVYGPGPMVLYVQLESMVGRPAVLAGIKDFLSVPGARSVDDLRLALEKASSQKLQEYFDAWVFGAGVPAWPTFTVQASQAGDQVTVQVTQQSASKKLFGCTVEVEVAGATQKVTAMVDFGVAPKMDTASATVTLAEPLVGTTLDPRHRLIGHDAAAQAKARPPRKVFLL